jgi:hypothetical protein
MESSRDGCGGGGDGGDCTAEAWAWRRDCAAGTTCASTFETQRKVCAWVVAGKEEEERIRKGKGRQNGGREEVNGQGRAKEVAHGTCMAYGGLHLGSGATGGGEWTEGKASSSVGSNARMTLTSSSSSSSSSSSFSSSLPGLPVPFLPLDFPFVGGDADDLDLLPPELLPGTMSSIRDTPLPVGEGVERVRLPLSPDDILLPPPLIPSTSLLGPLPPPPPPLAPLVAAIGEVDDRGGRGDRDLAIPDDCAAPLKASATILPPPVSNAELLPVADARTCWCGCWCWCCCGEQCRGGTGKGMGDCSHWGTASSRADGDIRRVWLPGGVLAPSSSEEESLLLVPAAAPRPPLISFNALRMSRVSDRPEDDMIAE